MNATVTQKMVEAILGAIGDLCNVVKGEVARIWFLAYSFDRMEIVDALIRCHKLGHKVRFGIDYHQTHYGNCRDQMACVRKLAAEGVEVNMIQGETLGPVYRAEGREMHGNWKGIQHAKGVLIQVPEIEGRATIVDRRDWFERGLGAHPNLITQIERREAKNLFVVGSSNWTLASRCNCEMSVIMDITENRSHSLEVEQMFEEYMNRGQLFNANRATASMRARSAPIVGRTQARFNAARALSASMQ